MRDTLAGISVSIHKHPTYGAVEKTMKISRLSTVLDRMHPRATLRVTLGSEVLVDLDRREEALAGCVDLLHRHTHLSSTV